MASKQTYECYVCKKNGFADTRVFLDGKTSDGKTIYKNTDMSPHRHNIQITKQQEQQPQQPTELALKLIHARLDRVVSLLESYNKMLYLLLDPAQKEQFDSRTLQDNR